MLKGWTALFVMLAMAGSPLSPSDPSTQATPAPWLQNLTLWLHAVAMHQPGVMDVPATLTGLVTEKELAALRADFLALLETHRSVVARAGRAAQVRYKNVSFTTTGLEELFGLTIEEAKRSDANGVLKRAAILHADVAMMVIPAMLDREADSAAKSLASSTTASVGCTAESSILVEDGYRTGTGCINIHWAHGRALLDAITPDPAKDPVVARWYQATIAFLLERLDYANAVPQIDHASQLFPRDAELLFQHGHYHEAFASRRFRAAVRASNTDSRSPTERLKEAEALFRRALEVNPDFIEARVHHGVVLGALGRHEDAAGALRKAATAAQGPYLQYYAEMFLGDEEQSLGRLDEARAHYNEAAALFPTAQSPRIALSALERRSGDRAAALAAMQLVLHMRARFPDSEEPWWSYYIWFNQDAPSRLRQLYRLFTIGDQR